MNEAKPQRRATVHERKCNALEALKPSLLAQAFTERPKK